MMANERLPDLGGLDTSAFVKACKAAGEAIHRFGAAFDRFSEAWRQLGLEHGLGQVRCSDNPGAHAADHLPCQLCGAAL